jgi:hypothetical protein
MSEQSYVTVPCIDCGEPVITERPSHSECPEFAGHSPNAEYGEGGVPVDEIKPLINQMTRRKKVLEGDNEHAVELLTHCINSLENTVEKHGGDL